MLRCTKIDIAQMIATTLLTAGKNKPNTSQVSIHEELLSQQWYIHILGNDAAVRTG